MYIPKHYRETDFEKALTVINNYPFALMVSAGDGIPHATHLPVLCIKQEGAYLLEFHLPRHNPHYEALAAGKPTKVIFKGPDTYISSSWYTFPEVSTWNYQAVHISGTPQQLDKEQLLEHLKRLTDRMEQHETSGYHLMDKPDEVVYGQLGPIEGFRMPIDNWEAAFKLSQKMDEENKQRIIEELHKRGTDNDLAIAKAMQQHST